MILFSLHTLPRRQVIEPLLHCGALVGAHAAQALLVPADRGDLGHDCLDPPEAACMGTLRYSTMPPGWSVPEAPIDTHFAPIDTHFARYSPKNHRSISAMVGSRITQPSRR